MSSSSRFHFAPVGPAREMIFKFLIAEGRRAAVASARAAAAVACGPVRAIQANESSESTRPGRGPGPLAWPGPPGPKSRRDRSIETQPQFGGVTPVRVSPGRAGASPGQEVSGSPPGDLNLLSRSWPGLCPVLRPGLDIKTPEGQNVGDDATNKQETASFA